MIDPGDERDAVQDLFAELAGLDHNTLPLDEFLRLWPKYERRLGRQTAVAIRAFLTAYQGNLRAARADGVMEAMEHWRGAAGTTITQIQTGDQASIQIGAHNSSQGVGSQPNPPHSTPRPDRWWIVASISAIAAMTVVALLILVDSYLVRAVIASGAIVAIWVLQLNPKYFYRRAALWMSAALAVSGGIPHLLAAYDPPPNSQLGEFLFELDGRLDASYYICTAVVAVAFIVAAIYSDRQRHIP